MNEQAGVATTEVAKVAAQHVDVAAGFYHASLTEAEERFYTVMETLGATSELACVGVGSDFKHPTELKPMKYKEAMSGDDVQA